MMVIWMLGDVDLTLIKKLQIRVLGG